MLGWGHTALRPILTNGRNIKQSHISFFELQTASMLKTLTPYLFFKCFELLFLSYLCPLPQETLRCCSANHLHTVCPCASRHRWEPKVNGSVNVKSRTKQCHHILSVMQKQIQALQSLCCFWRRDIKKETWQLTIKACKRCSEFAKSLQSGRN